MVDYPFVYAVFVGSGTPLGMETGYKDVTKLKLKNVFGFPQTECSRFLKDNHLKPQQIVIPTPEESMEGCTET